MKKYNLLRIETDQDNINQKSYVSNHSKQQLEENSNSDYEESVLSLLRILEQKRTGTACLGKVMINSEGQFKMGIKFSA